MKRVLSVALASAALILSAGPALAHVTVNPRELPKGSFGKLTFRVPNEKDNANTTAVEVDFPTDVKLEFVSVKPTPGWTYEVKKTGESVSAIVFTGGEIKPGEFQEFDVSAGPLPTDKDSVTFKALQTYSDGEVVRWIEEAKGDEEPEHPAPVLKLTAAADDHHDEASAEDDKAASSSDGTGRALAIVGIVLSAAAMTLSLRRKSPTASS